LAYCEIQLSRSRARAAVEADWPDAYGVDRYVRGTGMDPSAVRGDAAIAARILNCVTAQLNESTDRFAFAGLPQAEAYGIAIGLGVLAKLIKAGLTVARPFGALWVDLVQIGEHRRHRR
jgi:hypothetical protein